MNIALIGALLFRLLGVICISAGLYAFLGLAISYYSVSVTHQADIAHEVYFFFYDTLIWGGMFGLAGILLIVFSKPLGRIIAKGLE